jgi:hypothetical protein
MIQLSRQLQLWGPERSQVLIQVTMKITVFWDLMLCNLVDVYQHLVGTAAQGKQLWGQVPPKNIEHLPNYVHYSPEGRDFYCVLRP